MVRSLTGMFVVAGSGPAGVACASALLESGAQVVMVDPALELEPARARRVEAMAATTSNQWAPADVETFRAPMTASASGIPLKHAYGSDFPYRAARPSAIDLRNVAASPSHAKGGLSNVWGASILPYRDRDIDSWPISIADLEDHYRAVSALLPVSAVEDGLSEWFPLYAEHAVPLRSTSEVSALLSDLARDAQVLRDEHVCFGASRLAVRAADHGRPGCVYCGLCLYGCPYGYIFNSVSILDDLCASPRFSYRPGLWVERVTEANGRVRVITHDVATGAIEDLWADKVFLACGVYESTRAVLSSVEAWNRPTPLQDSAYFLVPLLRRSGDRATPGAENHSLSQAFIEIDDPEVSPHTVHLQVYGYSELYRSALRRMIGPIDHLIGGVLDARVLSRLLVLQGYLHSDESATMTVELDAPEPRGTGRLTVVGQPRNETRTTVEAVLGKLRDLRRSLRGRVVSPLLRIGEPGRGYHTGGSLPMRTTPHELESDIDGRPFGLTNVHVVDSSVLPTIPATTITLTTMANAHRIGVRASG